MVKRSSALEKNYPIGNNLSKKESSLILKEVRNLQLVQVAAWPETVDKVGKEVANYLKLLNFPQPNKAVIGSNAVMMRVEPLKWWLLGAQTPLLSTDDGTTLDLSHSFTQIEIGGIKAKIFLNRHLPIDLRDKYFPSNSLASSAIHHVSVKILKLKDSYHLFIPRGFALSLWEVFLETAKQFDFEVK